MYLCLALFCNIFHVFERVGGGFPWCTLTQKSVCVYLCTEVGVCEGERWANAHKSKMLED